MKNDSNLLTSRRFLPMFLTQFFGALNDNVYKQALLLVITYGLISQQSASVSTLNNLAALLFILPYFIFSATAGQIADKYERASLVRAIKILEIIIMLIGSVGFITGHLFLLMVALFLMGVHSTFFGPIKYAYLPQAMTTDELVGANGLFQMGTSLAILTGMMLAGVLMKLDSPLFWISGVTVFVAIMGYLASRFIPVMTAPQPDLTIDWNIFRTSWQTIANLYRLPIMWFTILGNSWFWFYGATFLTQVPEFSKSILLGDESVVIFLLTLFSVGTALGSLLCKTLTKNQVSLKLLPFGIAGLTIFAIDLYFTLSAMHLPPLANNAHYSIGMIFATQGAIRVFVDLFLLGFSGGIYIVPLYAYMQAYSPETSRARIIGANNILNAVFMVGSAIFSIVCLTLVNVSLPMLFAIVGVINLDIGIWLFLKLKKYSPAKPIMTHE